MAALRMTLVAVFAWARRSCVPRAKREDSRKIPLGRRTKVSTHLEAENIKVKEPAIYDRHGSCFTSTLLNRHSNLKSFSGCGHPPISALSRLRNSQPRLNKQSGLGDDLSERPRALFLSQSKKHWPRAAKSNLRHPSGSRQRSDVLCKSLASRNLDQPASASSPL
jgi:hypothetical protein